MQGTVNIPDLVDYLKSEGLVIVKATELAETQQLRDEKKRRDLLKKHVVTFPQAAFILGVSRATIDLWLKRKRIPENAVLTKNKIRYVLTDVVKKMQGV